MFKVKKNSWHFRWLQYYETLTGKTDLYYYDLPTNFCEYWRRVLLWPAIRIGFNIALVLIAIKLLLFAGASIGIGFMYILTAAVFLGLAFATIVYFSEYFPLHVRALFKKIDNDEFVKTVIKTHNEKICHMIDYERE